MNIKIDLRTVMNDPLHPIRIAVYVAIGVVALNALQGQFLRAAGWGDQAGPVFHAAPAALPAVLAGGVEIAEAILEFTGHSARGAWSGQVASTLIAVLFVYVLSPALLVWGLRARARYRAHLPVRGGATAIALALATGGFAVTTIVPAPLDAIASSRLFDVLKEDHRNAEVRDDLELDLYLMARRAQVWYFCSASPRRSEHSWMKKNRAGGPMLGMADLIEPGDSGVFLDGMTVRLGARTFTVHIDRADSLTLRGAAPRMGNPPSPDDDRIRGTVTLIAGVTPTGVNTVLEQ